MTTATMSQPAPQTLPVVHRPFPGGLFAALAGPAVLAASNVLVQLIPGYAAAEATPDVVEAVGANRGAATALVVIGFAATLLMVPGVWAVTLVLRERARWLPAVGGWMMATGYVASVALSTDTGMALMMAQVGLDPAFGHALDESFPNVMTVVYTVFGLGALGGGLILGLAMLRQRSAFPAWAGWALIASEPVRAIGLLGGIAPGPALASVLIGVAFAGVMLRARDSARIAAAQAPGQQ